MSPDANVRWIGICHSDDGGLTWSKATRINRWGISPYPVLLADGRIVVLYARRHTSEYGMFCTVSEDEGRTWSAEMTLRDDAAQGRGVIIRRDGMAHGWSGTDGGYPVAAQLRDGRVFAAYYFQHDEEDVPWPGGRKFIAGTFFELK
jgi:hypothetical protein